MAVGFTSGLNIHLKMVQETELSHLVLKTENIKHIQDNPFSSHFLSMCVSVLTTLVESYCSNYNYAFTSQFCNNRFSIFKSFILTTTSKRNVIVRFMIKLT